MSVPVPVRPLELLGAGREDGLRPGAASRSVWLLSGNGKQAVVSVSVIFPDNPCTAVGFVALCDITLLLIGRRFKLVFKPLLDVGLGVYGEEVNVLMER